MALVLQSEGLLEIECSQFVATELAELLDEARVALLAASGFAGRSDLSPPVRRSHATRACMRRPD